MVNTSTPSRGDVYFVSHGGPPSVEQYESGPFKAWQKFGRLITADPKPKGIVVVSAHWENERAQGVVVNSNASNPLIYDFYNFPKRLYELQFSSVAEPELQARVVSALEDAKIPVRREARGPDHGVWIPFLAAFGPISPFPIVQVSLPASGSAPTESIRLGAALGKLRDEGYAIVTTGQAVHNLRDLFTGKKMTYTRPFLDLLEGALSSPDPVSSTLQILKSPLYKSAHPTDEHFFPLFVALGALDSSTAAAGERDSRGDVKQEIFRAVVDIQGNPSKDEGLGWGMWRWTRSQA